MRLAKIIISLTLLIAPLTFWSCIKEELVIIPDVYVYQKIDLILPAYTDLNAPGNAIFIDKVGYRGNGIIVYRLNLDEFFAFDATCPQHIKENAAVKLSDDLGIVICPHCKTKYMLSEFGQASKGYPLKRYNVEVKNSSGNITLIISN